MAAMDLKFMRSQPPYPKRESKLTSSTMPAINPATGKRIVGRPFPKGLSGNPGGSGGRARQALNADTVREMHLAFRRGGRVAIDKVMKQQPAVFLKLLVLLVPREMEVTHKGGVKSMTDEQLEAGIEALQAMLAAADAGENAKVIDAVPEPGALTAPTQTRRKRRKTDVGAAVRDGDEVNT
jgi:hypothetical protein